MTFPTAVTLFKGSRRQRQLNFLLEGIGWEWPNRCDLLPSKGLQNPGNYCYRRAMTQVILHLPSFLNFIELHGSEQYPCIKPTPDECISCMLKCLVQTYWDADNIDDYLHSDSWALSRIDSITEDYLESSNDAYIRGSQDDAWNSFGIFLLNSVRNSSTSQGWQDSINALFQLVTSNTYICAKGHQRNTTINPGEWCMTISIHDEDKDDLEEAVHRELDTHTVEVNCSACEDFKIEHRIQTRIEAAPAHLFIMLHICDVNGCKKNTTVSYPEILDLTHWQRVEGLPLVYELSGVVRHSGKSVHQGHYVSQVRGPPIGDLEQISGLDDAEYYVSNMMEMLQNPLVGFNTYILAYTRKEGGWDLFVGWDPQGAHPVTAHRLRKEDRK